MKKITKTKVVEYQVYQCEYCDFEHESAPAVQYHTLSHTCEERVYDDVLFYRFQKFIDASDWIELMYGVHFKTKVYWDGPGWYSLKYYEHDDVCLKKENDVFNIEM